MTEFQTKLNALHQKLGEQGRRVLLAALGSVDAFFDMDPAKADLVIQGDDDLAAMIE